MMSKEMKLFSSIDLEKYFETWYNDMDGVDHFDMHIGLDEDQLKERFLITFSEDHEILLDKIDEKSKKFIKEWTTHSDQERKDKAEDWYYDRLESLNEEMSSKAEFTQRGMICTRAITVSDKEEFSFLAINQTYMDEHTGIGHCWSWNHEKAESHWGNGSHSHEVMLKALIPYSSIDQLRTLSLNLDPSCGEDEAEIRVIENSPVYLIAIDDEPLKVAIKLNA